MACEQIFNTTKGIADHILYDPKHIERYPAPEVAGWPSGKPGDSDLPKASPEKQVSGDEEPKTGDRDGTFPPLTIRS